MKTPKLIFGCGYLGERVAARWHATGQDVAVVTRNAGRADKFQKQGYTAIVADVTRPETLRQLPVADTLLFAVGYDRASGQSIMDVYAGGIRNVLTALPSVPRNFIYISTTGVYGPASGNWVDESTTPDPQRDGGRASQAAEHALAAHPLGKRGIILRLAGIYGPGRIPFLHQLRAGEPIEVPSTGYLNLIHVDDAATVVTSAVEPTSVKSPQNRNPQIYCVSDGHPVPRHEFYNEVARMIGAPQPRFVESDTTSPRAARARGDRRVRNDKMLSELQIKLAYPNYRSGLAAILKTNNQLQ